MSGFLAQQRAQIKQRLGVLWWYSGVMLFVQGGAAIINAYVGLWLVPRFVSPSQLGAVLPLSQIGALLGLPLAIILTPFLKFINVFTLRGEMGKVRSLLLDVLGIVAVSSVGVAIYTYWISPFVFLRMRVSGTALVWMLCSLGILGAVSPVLASALQSMQRFRVLAVSGLVGSPLRLAAVWLMVPALGIVGYFGAQLTVTVAGAAIAAWGLKGVLSRNVPRESYRGHLSEMMHYTWPFVFLTVAGSIQGASEPFAIRHFLSDQDSAGYYVITKFADIPYGLWGALSVTFFPLVSERHERGEAPGKLLRQSLAFILVVGGISSLILTSCANRLIGLTSTWAAYRSYAWLMGLLSLRMVLTQAVVCFSTYEIACRRFRFAWYAATLSLIESALIYGLAGIGFFQPWLPSDWWRALSELPTRRLSFVTAIMVGYTMLLFACMIVQLLVRGRRSGRASGPPQQARF